MAAATFVWKWFVILFEVIATCPLENTASPPRSTFGTSPVNHHHHHHELTPESRKTPYSKTYNAPNVTRLILNEAEKLQLTISSDLTLNMCLSPHWFEFGLREQSKKWLWIGSVGVNVKSSRWSKQNKTSLTSLARTTLATRRPCTRTAFSIFICPEVDLQFWQNHQRRSQSLLQLGVTEQLCKKGSVIINWRHCHHHHDHHDHHRHHHHDYRTSTDQLGEF